MQDSQHKLFDSSLQLTDYAKTKFITKSGGRNSYQKDDIAVKTLQSLQRAMVNQTVTPPTEPVNKYKFHRQNTINRFNDTLPVSNADQYTKDQELIAKVNPNFIKALQLRIKREEQFMRMNQRNNLIKTILTERKMGINVTVVPDDLKQEISRICS